MRTHSETAALIGPPAPQVKRHQINAHGQAPPEQAPPDTPIQRASCELESTYPTRKRIFDVTAATLALVLAAPLIVAIALVSRMVDGPGVLFAQRRVGLGGRQFTMWKFRSLTPRDDAEAATRWNIADDDRLTAWGRFLRKTSLDELPQLLNIMRGDMSLVGPRPERPHFAARFTERHKGYHRRHRMPPGLTGLAQVNGLRGDTSIAKRARMDNRYIDRWSVWLDLLIIVRTPLSLIKSGGR